jgi:RND superfamily putative drug exporter
VLVLLGRRAWWLPRWLDRVIPRISIEGEEFFAARDAAQGAGVVPAPAPSDGDG